VSNGRGHWPEYLIEAWALGVFMISAGAFTVLFEYPASPLHASVPGALARRFLIGAAMGLTAILLIYSPWGRRSGAHMNPAVTLSFLRLGKIAPRDALFYIIAQFIGGALGVLCVAAVLGPAFTAPPVSYIATVPGMVGTATAFAAEFLIAGLLMWVVLNVSSSPRLAPYTGMFAGALVCLYIGFEAPLSGMSINPARSLASALSGHVWTDFWIYLTAPVIGMQAGAAAFLATRRGAPVPCAKMCHSPTERCIHCGYEPPMSTAGLESEETRYRESGS
jgi:aquaporin Z